ncbi:MAG: ZIP family metal transporter [Vicinamibacterales bacterium]
MSTLWWIVGATVAMSAIAWVGLLVVALGEARLQRVVLPLVAFAAGSLLGGAFLHLLPEAVAVEGASMETFLPALAGFALFFLLEQFLAWHRSHAEGPATRTPVTYLILLADGLHNFVGGLAIGASFLVSVHVGVVTWIAAAAHEVPQELGDFGILVRGGWGRFSALAVNFLSAATIVPGGLVAYYWHANADVGPLLAFAAGNFVYVAASDLIPEVKHDRRLRNNAVHFTAFAAGMALIYVTRVVVGRWVVA